MPLLFLIEAICNRRTCYTNYESYNYFGCFHEKRQSAVCEYRPSSLLLAAFTNESIPKNLCLVSPNVAVWCFDAIWKIGSLNGLALRKQQMFFFIWISVPFVVPFSQKTEFFHFVSCYDSFFAFCRRTSLSELWDFCFKLSSQPSWRLQKLGNQR